jgi:hypothetical protein
MEEVYNPHFMKNKPGMVASEELEPYELLKAKAIWEDLANYTKQAVAKLTELGVHKQWANRPLEPFGYIDVLISSTDWANFMALRDEEGAQPEIRAVAELIKELMEADGPNYLQPGDWHLPYIELKKDIELICEYKGVPDITHLDIPDTEELLRRISVARCARLTIKPFDGDGSIEKELKRYNLLMVSRPVHASPAEHVATPDSPAFICDSTGKTGGWANPKEHGNFYGWRQFRKMIPHNTIEDR